MNNQLIDYSVYENKYTFNSRQNTFLLNKKNHFYFLIIFFSVIFLLSSCVILKPKSKNILTFYFVEIEHFQNYKDAIDLSNEIKKSEGAGVVFYDKSYRVLAGFYSSKNHAEKVVENLKNNYQKSQVFELEIFSFQDQKTFTEKQNLATKNLINKCLTLITELENLIVKMSTTEININQSKTIIQNIFSNYKSVLNEFSTQFKTNRKMNMSKQKANEILNSIDVILKTDKQNLVQVSRQELVNITIYFSRFMSII